ncbi:hypothetical protein WH47_12731 [Habropoda laboriosa]|uniref:Uncharacterized protein n=1 Tax=Habropoda laboriosa TaxID=597456 RepID=A0A0L7R4X7_9HYME|nr:hypothetical protein WH47_12731 [Habropoda laboriosa]
MHLVTIAFGDRDQPTIICSTSRFQREGEDGSGQRRKRISPRPRTEGNVAASTISI